VLRVFKEIAEVLAEGTIAGTESSSFSRNMEEDHGRLRQIEGQ
jgi:hypothetical protein